MFSPRFFAPRAFSPRHFAPDVVQNPKLPIEAEAGFANWLPPIRIDKNGKRIDAKSLKAEVLEAVPAPKLEKAEAAFKRIESKPVEAFNPDTLDGIATELQAISLFLPEFKVKLITQMREIAYQIQVRAEDERDVELLLLAM